jgi:hypothetical protein
MSKCEKICHREKFIVEGYLRARLIASICLFKYQPVYTSSL